MRRKLPSVLRQLRPLRRLAADKRGAALIEFGIAAPLLAFMIMIIVDSSRGFAQKARLESAAARTVEKATAMPTPPNSDYTALRQEAATASGQPIANVTLDTWAECNRVRQSTYTAVCGTNEEMGRYLSIAIRATYTPMFNAQSLARMYGGTGMGNGVLINGDAMVRLQ